MSWISCDKITDFVAKCSHHCRRATRQLKKETSDHQRKQKKSLV